MEALPLLLAVGDAAAQAVGVPIAAGLAKEIVTSCEDVAKHKKHARMLGAKSMQLSQALEEAPEAPGLEGTKIQERVDEVVAVLEKTRNRVDRWVKMSVVLITGKRNDIESGIEQSRQELDTALQIFSLKTQISQERGQKLAKTAAEQIDRENKEMFRQIITNQEHLMQVVQLSQGGETIARDVMQEGQEELKHMRLEKGHGLFSRSPTSGRRYLDMERGLLTLHDMTGIPPTIGILNGEIKKEGEIAIAGGNNSDIWRGRWLGQKQVALKTIRAVRSEDKKAEKRFISQIKIWSELENEHILLLYGIVTDIGTQIHMASGLVSPWLDNGNVLEYTGEHPEADKLHLLRGAAKGLSYLHDQNIVHGNVKCSNILVSDSGKACISDFGMAKTLEDITKTAASTTLQNMGCARWMAPEIIEGGSPSKASDTYSFAMAILELLTGKPPIAELKTDIAIIRAMTRAPIRPKRPTGDTVKRWLTDDLWALVLTCCETSQERPTMEGVSAALQAM
ncbi:hypothetical protein D9756_006553 [Leucocoprinus leucothites]|uniref:Protein kinase domain-containing protein n=1 Tax=Leucocoprinus leucothites TaxID=201217 RepID=A0A8H5G2G4_9AGAR|nr:hypothetical protein D9756_006553 [Leucoagaricus leucothites]